MHTLLFYTFVYTFYAFMMAQCDADSSQHLLHALDFVQHNSMHIGEYTGEYTAIYSKK